MPDLPARLVHQAAARMAFGDDREPESRDEWQHMAEYIPDAADLVAAVLDTLQEAGYRLVPHDEPARWITPAELAARVKENRPA